jgi:two-component system sensor histidine kinase VicK
MNELINSLLDIAQLEAGKMNVNMQNLDAAKIVKNLVQEHKQTAVAKNLQFTAKIPPKRLMFRSDPLLLGEVYSNLISNAIKYTPEGGKVKVVIDRIEDEIVFRVADSGYGIPKDLQSRIFTKFFRADNVRQIDTTGTGLGLYMVMQIARVLGGRLWFKSRENKGSSFYFALPTSKKR